MGSRADDEGGHSDTERKDDMEIAFSSPVSVPRTVSVTAQYLKRETYHAFRYVVITASTYGGAVRSKVFTLLYPSVLTTEGKKLLTCSCISENSMRVNAHIPMQKKRWP